MDKWNNFQHIDDIYMENNIFSKDGKKFIFPNSLLVLIKNLYRFAFQIEVDSGITPILYQQEAI